jgi:23S rRNA pseudouridine955/2504/2580 synthase
MSWNIVNIFEDDDLVVVSKPAGLIVHASTPDPDVESLENLVSRQCGRRMILLHRLDKETSGLVLLAKRKTASGPLSRAFENGQIRKSYFAIVNGTWRKDCNRIESFILRGDDGRLTSRVKAPGLKSITTFRRILSTEKATWLEAMPKTGRTHQIRLHCAGEGHPVMGDTRYGEPRKGDGSPIGSTSGSPIGSTSQALHSYRIDFLHPISKSPLRLFAPVPEFWHKYWLKDFAAADVNEKMKRLFAAPKTASA